MSAYTFDGKNARRIAESTRYVEGIRRGMLPANRGIIPSPGAVLTAWSESGVGAATGSGATRTYGAGSAVLMMPNAGGTASEAGDSIGVKSELLAPAPAGSMLFLTVKAGRYFLIGWECPA